MRARRDKRGATLIEAVLAVLVLGIAIPPLVGMFRAVSYHSTEDLYHEAGLRYADSLLEEIVSRAFEDPDLPAGSFGAEESARASFDDVDDYDGWGDSPPTALDGTALGGDPNYKRVAEVHSVTEANPDPTTPASDGSTRLKRIRVTVGWSGAGGGQVTLTTLRSNVAMGGGG
ncbi:MAG: type II secretion system protein [Planctomycetota bacterium]